MCLRVQVRSTVRGRSGFRLELQTGAVRRGWGNVLTEIGLLMGVCVCVCVDINRLGAALEP